jgi:hypothetical protein
VGAWLRKGIAEIADGRCKAAVYLLHSRTGTSWFHEYALGGAQEIWFLRGRVPFQEAGRQGAMPAPFDSLILAFYPNPPRSDTIFRAWA